jgi:hypothetical protein
MGVRFSEVQHFNRVLKNKHQTVSQGVRRFGKCSVFIICEHLQKPHNAGSRFQARFFNTLLSVRLGDACPFALFT